MKSYLRRLSLLLSILLCSVYLSSCGIVIIHRGSPDESTTASSVTEPPFSSEGPIIPDPPSVLRETQIDYSAAASAYLESVPFQHYQNENFILAATDTSYLSPHDGAANEAVSAEAYRRNQQVAERFGINLIITHDTENSMATRLRDQDSAGLVYADLLLVPTSAVTPMATEGLLGNLRSLMFADFTADYFNASSLNAFSNQYLTWAIAGEASLSPSGMSCLLFNRVILETAGAEMPYDLVDSGQWTWDQLYSYYAYAGGDSQPLAISLAWFSASAFVTSGVPMIRSAPDRSPTSSFDSRLDSFFDKLHLLYTFQPPYTDKNAPSGFFHDGNFLFLFTSFEQTANRQMTATHWGLLPMPKYEETQRSYVTLADPTTLVFAIPKKINDHALTGRILSALNAASYRVLLSADANNKKDTWFRDQDSPDMYMKIVYGLTFDFTLAVASYDTEILASSVDFVAASIRNNTYDLLYPSTASLLNQLLASHFPADP